MFPDHSVHTYRLWCLAETRRLANAWEMNDFFRITHNDMQACLEQLVNLRFADHTVIIETGMLCYELLSLPEVVTLV